MCAWLFPSPVRPMLTGSSSSPVGPERILPPACHFARTLWAGGRATAPATSCSSFAVPGWTPSAGKPIGVIPNVRETITRRPGRCPPAMDAIHPVSTAPEQDRVSKRLATRSLLQHHVRPAAAPDGAHRIPALPVIFEAHVWKRHLLTGNAPLRGRGERLHHRRQIVPVRQAVADEQDPGLRLPAARDAGDEEHPQKESCGTGHTAQLSGELVMACRSRCSCVQVSTFASAEDFIAEVVRLKPPAPLSTNPNGPVLGIVPPLTRSLSTSCLACSRALQTRLADGVNASVGTVTLTAA